MRGKWNKECSHCGQAISKEWAEHRKKLRADNVRIGLAKSKAAGNHIGRPITVNHEKIRELRKQGLSMRKIANIVGCSTHSVHYVLVYR